MDRLARKGVSEEDLAHWVWILEAPDADSKVDRFLSSDRPKPKFLLMAILRKDEELTKQSSLVRLYDYVAQMCQRARTAYPQIFPQGRGQIASLDSRKLPPKYFMVLLDRLLHHCMMKFPTSIVTVSRIVVDYLRSIAESPMPKKSNRRTGYADRCLVFNFALQRFSRTSRKLLTNLPHNWRAQRILLMYSAEIKRPLVINKLSYRAMRMVLIGLKKAQAEKGTAMRHSKTWPPYIKQLDGLDEAKENEEYLSRSVRAGILKRQEGYADEIFDNTLDTLGGAVFGESVTVQTRSKAPKIWSRQHEQLQIFSNWAARVRATRNAYEAWQMLHEPPSPRLKPNFQVYAEMFSKLFAKEVNPLAEVLPGDGKEVFPPYLGNWTQFEREKLRPCSPDELYERMLRDGNRPVHECLRVLLQNAPSLRAATQYLNDSPLDKNAVAHMTTFTEPKYEGLVKIPLPIFDAYIGLLCRQQGRQRWDPSSFLRGTPTAQAYQKYGHVTRAIKLVSIRLASKRQAAQEPWHTIMRVLAVENIVLRPYVTQAEDDMDSLKHLMSLFHTYETTQILHPFAFHCLCRCVRKVIRHANVGSIPDTGYGFITTAVRKMKSSFWELLTPVNESSERLQDDLPALYHEISSANINIYLQTLGHLEDVEEATRVMEWALASYGQEGILEKARDPEHKQWQYMQEAFVCFRVISDGHLPEAMMRKIEKRFKKLHEEGSSWEWPSDEYVRDYVEQRAGHTDTDG